MIEQLTSYAEFQESAKKFLDMYDSYLPSVLEAVRKVDEILEYAQRYKCPGCEYMEQSIRAIMLSILAATKSNMYNWSALQKRIEALDKLIQLHCCS